MSKDRRKAVDDYKEYCEYQTETGLWNCKECEKSGDPFSTVYVKSLVTHVEGVHLGICKAECLVCGKKFRNKESLKTHMLHHTGERPVQFPAVYSRFR